jgi:SAM-dependent methyltransferase
MTGWDTIWAKPLIISDYSLKYIKFMRERSIYFRHHSKIIEVGCGTGQTLKGFLWHDTVGFDISLPALQIAKQNCDDQVQGDIFTLPFKDESFDLVYNSGVIEHFPEPRNLAALKEMERITKRGGRIIVIVPNSLCLWYRFGKFIAVLLGKFEFGYEEDYTPNRLVTACEQMGLKPERIFGIQALPPLATNDKELLPEPLRKKIGRIEKHFPLKQFYAYTVGVIAKKGEMRLPLATNSAEAYEHINYRADPDHN